jgi:hypothetical protein
LIDPPDATHLALGSYFIDKDGCSLNEPKAAAPPQVARMASISM